MYRTFQRDDRLWAIERDGKTIRIRYGKVGGKQTERITLEASLHDSRVALHRQVNAKLRDGYKETTVWPQPPPLNRTGKALESAVIENPDDLVSVMAWADWLGEQPDPASQARAEFARVQLELEQPSLATNRKRALKKREKELRQLHERDWVGHPLAELLIDGEPDKLFANLARVDLGEVEFRRGWVSELQLNTLTDTMAKAIGEAPSLRLLRRLVIRDTYLEGAPLTALGKAKTLGNVRVFEVEEEDYVEGRVDTAIKAMPRIEEIRLRNFGLELGKLFALANLTNLRVLDVREVSYLSSIRSLSRNAALANLTHLTLIPDSELIDEGETLISPSDVKDILRSQQLSRVTHLTLHSVSNGDQVIHECILAGALKRLKLLDLSFSEITDEGANELAACPDLKNLEKLVLEGNFLTSAGIQTLRATGVKLDAPDQRDPDMWYNDWDYFDEDWE